MKKEEKKEATKLYMELLEEHGLVVTPFIQKRQSQDTGAWYDMIGVGVKYKDQKE